jgi:hypothetical protein
LDKKEESCHELEAEVVNLRKKVEMKKSKTFDEILDSQRSPNDKSGLGYNKEEINTPKKSDVTHSFAKSESKYDSGSSRSRNKRNTRKFRRSDHG